MKDKTDMYVIVKVVENNEVIDATGDILSGGDHYDLTHLAAAARCLMRLVAIQSTLGFEAALEQLTKETFEDRKIEPKDNTQ